MANTRYFIFRVNGIDNGITDDASKAREAFELLVQSGFKLINTDLNNMTTTYNFTI